MNNIPPPAAKTEAQETSLTPKQRGIIILLIIAGVVLFAGFVAAIYGMVSNPTLTTVIRDIFIIFMALESLLIGLALVVLMIQIARLTNLLQHEIKPILENTNETINTVRGTAIFVSENIVEPVVKINAYMAALGKLLDFLNFDTKKKK